MNFDFRNIDVAQQLTDPMELSIVDTPDLYQRTLERREAKDTGIPMPWGKLDALLYLRPGEVITLGAFSGHNKSLITSQIGLKAIREGFRVGVASLEMPAEDVIEQYSSIAAGRDKPAPEFLKAFCDWADQKLFVYDRVDAISPHEAIQLTIGLRMFFGADLVVLDCLFMLGVDSDTEADFMRTLAAVAKKFQVAILLVHHVRKPSGKDGEKHLPDKADLLGSSHLVNATSTLIFVWHNKDKFYAMNDGKPYDDEQPDLLLKVAKQRNGRYEGVTAYWQHERCRAFCSTRQRRLDVMTIPVNQANHCVACDGEGCGHCESAP